MRNKFVTTSIFSLLFCISIFAQDKEKNDTEKLPEALEIEEVTEIREPINPLSPAKAAFYSAVLPGLGQAYNKKYWKIPIVYVAIGTGVYFYLNNNKEYNRYRDAYKSRLAGFTNDEFYLDGQGNQLSTPRVSDGV